MEILVLDEEIDKALNAGDYERAGALIWAKRAMSGECPICIRCGNPHVHSGKSAREHPDYCASCWPLRHIPLRESKEEVPPPNQKKCVVCFGFFEPGHSKQIYCGDKCRERAKYRRRAWGKNYAKTLEDRATDPAFERTCAVCGKSLAGKRKQAKYCSPKCRKRAARRRTKEGRELPDTPKNHA